MWKFLGMKKRAAVAWLRLCRPGSVQVSEQEDFLLEEEPFPSYTTTKEPAYYKPPHKSSGSVEGQQQGFQENGNPGRPSIRPFQDHSGEGVNFAMNDMTLTREYSSNDPSLINNPFARSFFQTETIEGKILADGQHREVAATHQHGVPHLSNGSHHIQAPNMFGMPQAPDRISTSYNDGYPKAFPVSGAGQGNGFLQIPHQNQMYQSQPKLDQPLRFNRFGSYQDGYTQSPLLSPSPQHFGGFFGNPPASPSGHGHPLSTRRGPEFDHLGHNPQFFLAPNHQRKDSSPLSYSYPGQVLPPDQTTPGDKFPYQFQGDYQGKGGLQSPAFLHNVPNSPAFGKPPFPGSPGLYHHQSAALNRSFVEPDSQVHGNFLDVGQPNHHARSFSMKVRGPEHGYQSNNPHPTLNYIGDTEEDVIVRSPPGMKIKREAMRHGADPKSKAVYANLLGRRQTEIYGQEPPKPNNDGRGLYSQHESNTNFLYTPQQNGNLPPNPTSRVHRPSEVLDLMMQSRHRLTR
jgi:hypothetical protein